MTNIFTNHDGDEAFSRSGYKDGKVIHSRLTVLTEGAITAATLLDVQHGRQSALAHRKMKAHLLALRLPVSRLKLVFEIATALSRPSDPLGRGITPAHIYRCNVAHLVARAALSILADVPTEKPADVWAQFYLVLQNPGALPASQRKRVAARLMRFVGEHLAGAPMPARWRKPAKLAKAPKARAVAPVTHCAAVAA